MDYTNTPHVAGATRSVGFPTTTGAYDTSHNGDEDVFVVRLSHMGTGMFYATYLGGSGDDRGLGLFVDGAGFPYVAGVTYSSDFPTSNAYDTTYHGNGDAFAVRLQPGGNALNFSTYLGGSGTDEGCDISVGDQFYNRAYVVGRTESADFPTTGGAYDQTHNGQGDAFVVKLGAAGNSLDYATFLGGTAQDDGFGIVALGSGEAYLTGSSHSSDFPTTAGVFDETHNGQGDVFAARLNSMGTALVYATFLGGLGDEAGQDIAVDTSGCAYLTGVTGSADFPATGGAFDETHNGQEDVFVVRLDPTATALGYATFLGGSGDDGGYGIVLDTAGCAYLTGLTESVDFPATVGAFDESYNGLGDVFVAKLAPSGNGLVNATYLGGSDLDQGYGIDLTIDGYAHLTGLTRSNDFPATSGVFDPTHNGNQDAFVCKLDMAVGDLTPPEAIDDLTIDVISGAKVSNGDIHLMWSEPYDDVGVVRYVIFRSIVAGNSGDSLAGTVDTVYIDVGAAGDAGTNYFYVVKAADAAGNKSEASNPVGEFDMDVLNAPAVK